MSGLVILGAGIAGISAGYHANLKGLKSVIFEAKQNWGGLLDNFSIKEFRFDQAVHLSFTKDSYVKELFTQVPHFCYHPNPINFEKDKWLKHPVQNNLYPLPIDEKVALIKDFIEKQQDLELTNYEDWLISKFGKSIAERFPLKYTHKYWTVPAKDLSLNWIGNRMYKPNLEEVLYGAMSSKTPNTYYAQEMRYPIKGGYKSFLEPLTKGLDIQTNKKVIYINPDKKFIEFEDGQKAYYETLISSLPLPDIIRTIDNIPEHIQDAADKLWATSIALVSVGFNRPDVIKNLWFYIYDKDILAARVYSPSQKSPDNAPDSCSSVQFEYYYSKHKPLNLNQDELIEHTIKSLKKMHLADKNDIAVIDCRYISHGNVVFDQLIIKNKTIIRDYLASKDIFTAGRFGEWDYLWSDQSLLSGKNALEKVITLLKK